MVPVFFRRRSLGNCRVTTDFFLFIKKVFQSFRNPPGVFKAECSRALFADRQSTSSYTDKVDEQTILSSKYCLLLSPKTGSAFHGLMVSSNPCSYSPLLIRVFCSLETPVLPSTPGRTLLHFAVTDTSISYSSQLPRCTWPCLYCA